MINGVIFDYDGLLVNTEHGWLLSRLAVLREFGVEVPESEYEALVQANVGPYLVRTYNLPASPEAVIQRSRELFTKVLPEGIQPMPGAEKLVKSLHGRMPLAIGSSSKVARITGVLSDLKLLEYFSAIIGGDVVEKHKPHPETFLKAAESIGLPAAECIVLEDTVHGLKAARAAGMRCIVIPNKDIKNADLGDADFIAESLEEISEETLRSL